MDSSSQNANIREEASRCMKYSNFSNNYHIYSNPTQQSLLYQQPLSQQQQPQQLSHQQLPHQEPPSQEQPSQLSLQYQPLHYSFDFIAPSTSRAVAVTSENSEVDFGLKKEMWGEALYTSAYLLNRSPTDTLNVTPYEMWNKEKPNIKNIQFFGCEAYAKVLKPIKKLDDRSKNYILVGYAPTGYRLWDAEKRKIKIARDVKFLQRTIGETNESKRRT